MISNDDYTEFDIKAIVFYILRKWKPILILGLVLALLMGGWMAYSEYRTSQNSDSNSGYWLEYNQYQDQIAIVQDHINLTQSRIDTLQDYLDQSMLMRIDPRNVYRAKAVYYVDSGYQIMPDHTYQDPDKTSTIAWYYRRFINNYDVMAEISQKLGMETKYLMELVEVSLPNEYTVYISVCYYDEAGAVMIADMLQEQLNIAQKELTQSIGEHTITVMEDSCGVYIDESLNKEQKAAEEELLDLKDDLLKYTEALKEIKEGPAPSELNVTKAFIKWFIIWGVIGAVVVVVYLFLKSLLSGRVHAPSQVASGFQTRILGEVICNKARLSPFVRKLNSLEGCLTENSENNLQFLAENIKNSCGDAKNILICCDTNTANVAVLADSLNEYLNPIQLQPAGNLLKDVAALRQLAQSDAVLIITERDRSRSRLIRNMLKTVRSYQKEVIGFVVTY